MRIEVPHTPPTECSPNWRGSWPEQYQAGRDYGLSVFYSCVDYRNRQGGDFTPIRVAKLNLTVVYALERTRDIDNIITMFKPGLDAIVRAGLIESDDNKHLHWGNIQVEVDRTRAPLTIIELSEETLI